MTRRRFARNPFASSLGVRTIHADLFADDLAGKRVAPTEGKYFFQLMYFLHVRAAPSGREVCRPDQ